MKTGKWTMRILAFALGVSLAGNLYLTRIVIRQNQALQILIERLEDASGQGEPQPASTIPSTGHSGRSPLPAEDPNRPDL